MVEKSNDDAHQRATDSANDPIFGHSVKQALGWMCGFALFFPLLLLILAILTPIMTAIVRHVMFGGSQ